jgi:hypothetical protein
VTVAGELDRHFAGHFRVLILDNEVTLDAFVADPPLPWARLVAPEGGQYGIGAGYPTLLTAEQAKREALNWDRVSEPAISAALRDLGEAVDMAVFGNNAGQGLPLAEALPQALRGTRGAIVYGRSLPERADYEAAGYRQFSARGEILALIAAAAAAAERPPALAFINTIEHNERNYHAPWPG